MTERASGSEDHRDVTLSISLHIKDKGLKVKVGPVLESERWVPALISGLGNQRRRWYNPLIWGRLPLLSPDPRFTSQLNAAPQFTTAL